tara:strand:- start:1319 stop:1591 length:273 start_codon:yes stop_codon:yes gene_type:complete
MRLEPVDSEFFISKYKTMRIKKTINCWQEMNDYSPKSQSLNVAKNVLEIKNKERQEQLEILTSSLTSSSRIARWISSSKGVIKQFLRIRN